MGLLCLNNQAENQKKYELKKLFHRNSIFKSVPCYFTLFVVVIIKILNILEYHGIGMLSLRRTVTHTENRYNTFSHLFVSLLIWMNLSAIICNRPIE